MASNPKKIRLGIDRISDMPDLILSKILCNLPTKYAVGTSILSTRWKNFFRYEFMPSKLHFDDTLLLNPNKGENNNSNNTPSVTFIDFVDKLLKVVALSDVEEIILHSDKGYCEELVVSWVRAALRLNVQHLDLKFPLYNSTTLIHSLSGCTTLVTLKLELGFHLFFLPNDFSLPNLKRLQLFRMRFVDKDGEWNSIKEFIRGCPVLEYLHIFQCEVYYLGVLCIQSPLLKHLVIEQYWPQSISRLILDLPNLQHLVYDNILVRPVSLGLSKSLRTAHIKFPVTNSLKGNASYDGSLWYPNDAAKIVSACCSTIRLHLCSDVIDSLHRSSMQLPMFQNLISLSLGCRWLKWELFARLLSSAPNLQELKLGEGFRNDAVDYANFQNIAAVTPECLKLHLKRIEFQVFKGDGDEMKLVDYFLKNGEVLEKLVLPCLPAVDTSLSTRLLRMPRQSKTCDIEFNGKSSDNLICRLYSSWERSLQHYEGSTQE